MKPTEFDSLMNSASSSNSSNNSNLRSGKSRNGFPPITREARSRTRRWLLLLIIFLILLFLGWRFLLRPWLFPNENQSTEIRGRTHLYSTTLPYDDYDQHISSEVSEISSSTPSPTSSTLRLTEKPPSNDDKPEVMLRPPAITWTGKQEDTKPVEEVDPISSLESRFKIQADLSGGESGWKEKPSDHTNPQLEAVVTGRYSDADLHRFEHATARPQTTQQPDFNRIQTTTVSKNQIEEDEYDENKILFERPKSNPAAKVHPSVNLSKHTSTPTAITTSTPSTITTASDSPRKSDGSHIVHPHANSGALNNRDSTQETTKQYLQTTTSTTQKDPSIDADLKDLISQLEKDAPVWRIAPEDLSKVTPPPRPDEQKDVSPKFRVPSFSIQASVQTIPANKGKEHKPSYELSERRHKIDKRSDTPVIVTGLLNIGRGDWQMTDSLLTVKERYEYVKFNFDEQEKKKEKKKKDKDVDYGWQPKMIRCAVFHEFIYKVVHEMNDDDPTLLSLYDRFPLDKILPKNEESTPIQELPITNQDPESPYRHVVRIPPFKSIQCGWFMVRDALLGMPLSIYVLLVKQENFIEGLQELLDDPESRHIPLADLSVSMRKKLFTKEAALTIEYICQLLSVMGLMRFGSKGGTGHNALFFCSKKAFFYDTSNSAPGKALISHPITQYTCYEYNFERIEDVSRYWNHLRAICFSTPLNRKSPGEKFKTDEKRYKMGRLKNQQLFAADYNLKIDEISPVGTFNGCAGFDADLFVHMPVNWKINMIQDSAFTSWFLTRSQKGSTQALTHVSERVVKLNNIWRNDPKPKKEKKALPPNQKEGPIKLTFVDECGNSIEFDHKWESNIDKLKQKYMRQTDLKCSEFAFFFNNNQLKLNTKLYEIDGLEDGSNIEVQINAVIDPDIVTDGFESVKDHLIHPRSIPKQESPYAAVYLIPLLHGDPAELKTFDLLSLLDYYGTTNDRDLLKRFEYHCKQHNNLSKKRDLRASTHGIIKFAEWTFESEEIKSGKFSCPNEAALAYEIAISRFRRFFSRNAQTFCYPGANSVDYNFSLSKKIESDEDLKKVWDQLIKVMREFKLIEKQDGRELETEFGDQVVLDSADFVAMLKPIKEEEQLQEETDYYDDDLDSNNQEARIGEKKKLSRLEHSLNKTDKPQIPRRVVEKRERKLDKVDEEPEGLDVKMKKRKMSKLHEESVEKVGRTLSLPADTEKSEDQIIEDAALREKVKKIGRKATNR